MLVGMSQNESFGNPKKFDSLTLSSPASLAQVLQEVLADPRKT